MTIIRWRGGGFGRPRRTVSAAALLLLIGLADTTAWADVHMKQIASINQGNFWSNGNIAPYKARADTYPTLVFAGGIPGPYAASSFYRYVPVNRYSVAKIDTGVIGDSTIQPGFMAPWAAGDVDGDSEVELVAENGQDVIGRQDYMLASLYGTNERTRCLDSLAWCVRYDSSHSYFCEPYYITDLDQDGKKEVTFFSYTRNRIYVYECVADNQLRLAATVPCMSGYALAIGDFDGDSETELATAGAVTNNQVVIYKCTGDDQYVPWDSVSIQKPNADDVFSASNLDGSHRAVFFVSFFRADGKIWLYEFEPTQGTRGYQAFGVDSTFIPTGQAYARSLCGDIDGDGIEEVVWSTGNQIRVYESTGLHLYELQWYWDQGGNNSCNLNLYDMNGNGYNEILETGSGATHIFEIEAIKVLYPSARFIEFHPGDTCPIRWETYFPPRCDSISLFLRTDTVWSLADTIAHGIAPSETSYDWIVPDLSRNYRQGDTPPRTAGSHPSLDSCRIVAIAYGPGWQYDESDNPFRIVSSGISEAAPPLIRETKLLGAFPNPCVAHARIQFQLREPSHVTLRVSDVTGRTVATLADEVLRSGRYNRDWEVAPTIPAGVYFLNFTAANQRQTEKLMITQQGRTTK
jgi:hypothetical protein